MPAQAHYTLELKIKDPNFSIDHLQDYSLLMQAGSAQFQLAVVDTKSSRCLLLEHYQLHQVQSTQDFAKLVERMFEEHHLLMAGFWHSVKFSIKNQRFSLVPAALFDKEEAAAYLVPVAQSSAVDEVLYYSHMKDKIVTVFGFEQAILTWLNTRYPNLKLQILHHVSAFTEGVLYSPDHSSRKDVYLMHENGQLTVLITQQGHLYYCNIFRTASPQEVVKYCMMVFRQFGLDQQNTKVQVYGDVQLESDWFKELAQYIQLISFGTRPRFLKFRYMFDEAPDNRFFDLFSLYLCE